MYKAYLDTAIEAVKEAGKFLSKKENLVIDVENGKDIKLSADKQSEKIIIDILSKTGVAILAEESGAVLEGENDLRWIVDPLDGSANYVRGLEELTCISIGLWKDKEPVLGVVYRYVQDELYYGIVGEGAFLNGKPVKTSEVVVVEKAIIATGMPVNRDYSADSLNKFVGALQHFKKVRMLGSAATMSTLVAAGKVDTYIEENIMLWDIAAAVAIIKAAGGIVRLEHRENNMVLCECFSNAKLMEDYDAKVL